MNPYRVLTIAGSDSGGSAGIQADLKTFTARGVFGMTAITVVTAQNTQGVYEAMPLPVQLVAAQIDAVLQDIGVDAVKTGLLGTLDIVEVVYDRLHGLSDIPIVIDPVLVNGAGNAIVSADVVTAYRDFLVPLATVLTPNIYEAALLTDLAPIADAAMMREAAELLHQMGAGNVLVKGGFLDETSISDLFYNGQTIELINADRLPVNNPHGVGCTFASAIAAELARGQSVFDAVSEAHSYLQRTLSASLDWKLGKGRSPVNHFGTSPSLLNSDEIPL